MQLSDTKRLIQDFISCVLSNKTATIQPYWVNKSGFVVVAGELLASLKMTQLPSTEH